MVCSEREDAGLAAAPVALRRLPRLVAMRRDLAALVAAARRLLRGGGAVAPVGRAPAATVSVRPAIEPIAPRGARRRGRSEHRAVRTAPRRRLLGAPALARRLLLRLRVIAAQIGRPLWAPPGNREARKRTTPRHRRRRTQAQTPRRNRPAPARVYYVFLGGGAAVDRGKWGWCRRGAP